MNLILLASLALTAIATPTGDQIFKRATSSFCKKAKTGCTNSGEKAGVQSFCSSYLGLPPQKTKTFVDLETSTVYTTTMTTTMTSYIGSYSGGPHTQTNTETVTAADASTTTVTENGGGTAWVFPSQCNPGAPQGSAVAVAARAAATQPVCFSKYGAKTQLSSACGCFTLTATIPATSLIESTTTISTAFLASVTTTIAGPIVTTSTTTLTEVTSTTTIASGATISAFALQDAASGNYASQNADITAFNTGASGADAFLLDSDGNLSWATGYWANNGAWQGQGSSPDFVRFEGPTNFGYPMNPVTCHITRASGQCSLSCAVAAQGWTQNCLYNEPNDSRNGGWVLAMSPSVGSIPFCNYVNAPLIMPLPN